jgi:acetyl esterase/lipase
LRRTIARYGRARANIAELWRPDRVDGDLPVVVLIHGGYWRAPHTKRLMRPLSKAISDEGWAVWNIEYRRTGRFGGGGGWPATFLDVAAAVDALARVPGIDLGRIVTCGHSAGGQLALWAAGRHRLPAGAPGAAPRLSVRAAVSLAGVVDLRRAAALGLGAGAVPTLLGGDPGSYPDRYAIASPAALLPLGVGQALIHGRDDETVPCSLSEDYCTAALAAGDTDVTFLAPPAVDHMAIIDPHSPAWTPLRDTLHRFMR